jgi:hypothetical protein
MISQEEQQNTTAATFTRFYEIELEKTLDTINAIQNRRSQLGVFFGTGTLSQKAVVFLISACVALAFMYIDYIERSFIIAYYYRYLELRQRFVPNDPLIDIFFSEDIKRKMLAILQNPDPHQRNRALRKLSRSHWTPSSREVPIVVAFLQIIFALILTFAFNWNFF